MESGGRAMERGQSEARRSCSNKLAIERFVSMLCLERNTACDGGAPAARLRQNVSTTTTQADQNGTAATNCYITKTSRFELRSLACRHDIGFFETPRWPSRGPGLVPKLRALTQRSACLSGAAPLPDLPKQCF
jgi:hypothetical protein